MIAVVDDLSEHRIEIGAAAPARLRRAFVQHDARAFLRQRGRGGEPGQSRADDMERLFAHPHEPVAQHDHRKLRLGQAYAFAWRRPALHLHRRQDRGIDRAHQPRRADAALRLGAQDRVRLLVVIMRQPRAGPARRIDTRIGEHNFRIACRDAGAFEMIAREIEAADGGVLVEIAQDIGELQRAAEMMGEFEARPVVHAEHLDRQPPHRARHAVAIKIEDDEIGRDDVLRHIHLHAVDHGEEILLAQAIARDRVLQERALDRRASGIERVEIAPPFGERGEAFLARADAVVGDVVDHAAEGIDREHRLAFGARHQPHGGIERASLGLLLDGQNFAWCCGHERRRPRNPRNARKASGINSNLR